MNDNAAEKTTEFVVAALIRIRKEKGLSQVELSAKAGLSRSGLGHIEAGRVTPAFCNVVRLCLAMDLNLEEILLEFKSATAE